MKKIIMIALVALGTNSCSSNVGRYQSIGDGAYIDTKEGIVIETGVDNEHHLQVTHINLETGEVKTIKGKFN